ARALHSLSPRFGGPFVAVNCAALAENLLDSELFGHERGAFTGAERQRAGKFEAADRGTLFLDEIGETSPAMQAKLLRVLQEKSFQRVGGNKTINTDVRVVAATNRDLAAEVANGSFRQDLYYRLNVFPIQIPPLRDRGDDVILLATHFLATLATRHGRSAERLTSAAEERLRRHAWPGNVRELYNAVERAVILSQTPTVDESAFMTLPQSSSPDPAADQGDIRRSQPINLKTLERDAIDRALKKTEGNRRKASDLLGIGLRTLQYKIKEYDLT
ncbi:MAG: two-component system response regulator HydG, partial [Myxococcota bacterium]